MALTSEIIDYTVSAGDSILTKGSEVIQNFAASTNHYDQDINWMVCLTVLIVCLIVCVTICICFNVVSGIKKDAKKKEYDLEVQKLDKKEEIWNLKFHKHLLEKDNMVYKSFWEIEKQKEALDFEKMKGDWEIEKHKEAIDLENTKQKEDWEQDKKIEENRKEDEKKIIELEKELAVAKAVQSDREKRKNEGVW